MPSEFRHAARQLVKAPGFTIVATVTIALGIGANTAVFSLINAVLLRFLPVPNPQQLVLFHLKNQPLNTSQSGYDDTSLSLPVFDAMRTRHDIFRDVVASAPLAFGKVTVRFGAEPEQAHGELVSGNYFSGLGVQLYRGRGFTSQDEAQNAPVAVLSYRWWSSRFGAAPDILGRTLYVKGEPLTIVGVGPAGFEGSDPGQPNMDFWIPLQRNPALSPWGSGPGGVTLYGSPNFLCLMLIGRLKPGISPLEAATQLAPSFRRTLAETAPVDPRDRKPELVFSDVRGIGTLQEDYDHPLHVLMTMVALVLLIASANVAMLLLLRNAAKNREFALRRALGATGRALFGLLFAESVLLVTVGCALAWFLAETATEALIRWSGLDFTVEPDRQVLLFAIAISAVIAIAFGLLPMLAVARLPLAPTLKASPATSNTDRRLLWGRKLVIALQIAFCAVLLFAGELLYATLRNLEASDLGMRTAGVLVFGITPQSNIRTDSDAIRLHLRILERLRALPGVDAATVSQVRLGTGGSSNDGVLVDGRNPLPSRPYAPARYNEVGSDFLRTLGIPLHLGRDFEQPDMVGKNRVAVVNQTFADRYLPHQNPLGHVIAPFESPTTRFTIVGVAGNSRYTGVKERDYPTAYAPFTQLPGVSEMQYELHTAGNPQTILPEVLQAVHAIDPNLPLENPLTQREQFDRSISQQRLVARLSMSFAALAMFLVLVGLYGTISYSVARRSTEIGVRMALGARRREVLNMVVRETAHLAGAGLLIALPVAFALARMLQSMLFGLSSADPIACFAAISGVALVTICATWIPARRAVSLDPMRALRTE
jgi:predicted permease